MTPEHDLKHPDNLQDPFPAYRWLRDNDPVHWSECLRGWVVTRYDDALHVLQNPLRFSADRFRKLGEEFASKRASVQDVAAVMRDWFALTPTATDNWLLPKVKSSHPASSVVPPLPRLPAKENTSPRVGVS